MLFRSWFERHWVGAIKGALLAFGPLMVVCNLAAQQVPFNAIFLISDPMQKWRLFANFVLYFLPFLAGALYLGVVFLKAQKTFNRVYFADPSAANRRSAWQRLRDTHRPKALAAASDVELERVIHGMLRERPAYRDEAVGRAAVASAHPVATAADWAWLAISSRSRSVISAASAPTVPAPANRVRRFRVSGAVLAWACTGAVLLLMATPSVRSGPARPTPQV